MHAVSMILLNFVYPISVDILVYHLTLAVVLSNLNSKINNDSIVIVCSVYMYRAFHYFVVWVCNVITPFFILRRWSRRWSRRGRGGGRGGGRGSGCISITAISLVVVIMAHTRKENGRVQY